MVYTVTMNPATYERVYNLQFATVYPLYVQKAERKGRSGQEVDEIISWLTGYDATAIKKIATETTTMREFFQNAPAPNPNRNLITGVICGVRIENLDDPIMREIRYLDKLIDELAKGRPMEKIQRSGD